MARVIYLPGLKPEDSYTLDNPEPPPDVETHHHMQELKRMPRTTLHPPPDTT